MGDLILGHRFVCDPLHRGDVEDVRVDRHHVTLDLDLNGLAQTAGVARSATKAWRFVDEMREVAATQEAAGLTPDLFAAIAGIYAGIARTELAQGDPESARELSADDIVRLLGR